MIIGIDHGYYAIKSRNFSFPAGVTAYTHEPYTLKNTLQIGGKYFVCGTGRQPILRDKTVNDNYYILTLAAIAMELRYRAFPAESSVTLAAGLPLARYGRDKKSFTEYLLRNGQPVNFLFEGERYKVKIESVKLFPQGYSAIAIHPELVKDEPSVLLMDIGGWTVDLMRLDNNVPNAATCRSLELGMIRCMDEIQEQVRRDTGLSVTDAQVERILAGKPCSMDEEARKLIQRQGRLYTERLISAAMEAGFDLLNCGEGMRTYHMAVLSSPCSDFRWLYLYTNQKKDVFLDSHVKFFEMVGGCYREVVYDNMKNVVSKFIGKNEKSVLFATVPNLIVELKEAMSQNQLGIYSRKFERYNLVILDELGYVSFDKAGCELLFNLLSNRHGKGSIVITTNLAFEQWENLFKDPVLTGAIIDRLAHKAHVLDISREQGGRFEETIAWMTNKQPAKIDDAD